MAPVDHFRQLISQIPNRQRRLAFKVKKDRENEHHFEVGETKDGPFLQISNYETQAFFRNKKHSNQKVEENKVDIDNQHKMYLDYLAEIENVLVKETETHEKPTTDFITLKTNTQCKSAHGKESTQILPT